MNDLDRESFVENDEHLYWLCRHWRRQNKGGMRGFIRAHRKKIDEYHEQVMSGRRPAHTFLSFDG